MQQLRDKLAKRSRRNAETGCLEWTGNISWDGYGTINIGGPKKAHRVSFEVEFGYSPRVVCHTCDNPRCIEPSHLYAGDMKSNVDDMVRRGRWRRGSTREMPAIVPKRSLDSSHHRSKLDASHVSEIIRMFSYNSTVTSIAKRMGVHRNTVYRVLHSAGKM